MGVAAGVLCTLLPRRYACARQIRIGFLIMALQDRPPEHPEELSR